MKKIKQQNITFIVFGSRRLTAKGNRELLEWWKWSVLDWGAGYTSCMHLSKLRLCTPDLHFTVYKFYLNLEKNWGVRAGRALGKRIEFLTRQNEIKKKTTILTFNKFRGKQNNWPQNMNLKYSLTDMNQKRQEPIQLRWWWIKTKLGMLNKTQDCQI